MVESRSVPGGKALALCLDGEPIPCQHGAVLETSTDLTPTLSLHLVLEEGLIDIDLPT